MPEEPNERPVDPSDGDAMRRLVNDGIGLIFDVDRSVMTQECARALDRAIEAVDVLRKWDLRRLVGRRRSNEPLSALARSLHEMDPDLLLAIQVAHTYDPMTENELRRLLSDALAQQGTLAPEARHELSLGRSETSHLEFMLSMFRSSLKSCGDHLGGSIETLDEVGDLHLDWERFGLSHLGRLRSPRASSASALPSPSGQMTGPPRRRRSINGLPGTAPPPRWFARWCGLSTKVRRTV